MRLPRVAILAAALALLIAGAAAGQNPAETRTLKERLSDKASDAQRVDNCHVPPERRGSLPRPDCATPPAAALRESPAPASAARR